MGDGWETARNPNRPPVLEADDNGILQVKAMMVMVTMTVKTMMVMVTMMVTAMMVMGTMMTLNINNKL